MLTEQNLVDIGFKKLPMLGNSFWNTPTQYFYTKGNIAINATHHWTWFLDGVQRNDIAVNSKEKLIELCKNL